MKQKIKKLWALLRNPKKLKMYAFWIGKQTSRFWPVLLLMTLVNVVLILVGFGSSFVSRAVVDNATANLPYARAFTVMILLTAISILLGVGTGVVSTYVNERFAFRIRMKNFDHFLTADYLKLSKFHTGDLLTRLTSDAGSVATSITSAIPSLIMIFIRLIVAFVLLYHFAPFLALSALLLAPCGLIVSLLTGRRLKALSVEAKENEAAYRSFLQEHAANISVVKTFCMEDESRKKLNALVNNSIRTTMKRTKMSVLTSNIIRCFFTIGYLLSFGYCIRGLHEGGLTYGTMTLFLSLFSQIQQPLMSLGNLLPQAIGILASADRIMELENIPDESRSGQSELTDKVSVRFDDVSFSYGQREVLKNISFHAQSGCLVGIMGPSGVGKTTLIRMILSLIQPTAGKITFLYDNKEEPLSADVRRMIAYVPQGNTLLSGSIRENLLWGNARASEEEMYASLENADAGFVRTLPDGLDTIIGEKATGLSEGQAQRIAIARALLRKAPVLILDEATSALDEDSERAILTRLLEKSEARPLCFIITHRRSMREYFDRVITIEKGGSIRLSDNCG